MAEQKIQFYPRGSATAPGTASATELTAALATQQSQSSAEAMQVAEPSTCIEAEPYALRVLDDSMEPEFRRGCIIVIDPTGRAKDGSFVLARVNVTDTDAETDGYVFRQLCIAGAESKISAKLSALNERYQTEPTAADLSEIVGVIVQRAGLRRSYHKHYE